MQLPYYEELRQKGYGYAGWAHGVATGESVTGRAALGFLTDTANRELTQAEMDGIRIGMANGYLNALSANIKKDHGKTQTDITFEQMRNFHKDVFEKHHLSIDNWTLETPMYLLGKYGGGRRAQEEAWQRLAATEGYGMDALMASMSVYNMTVEFANGRVTVDRQGRFITHNPWDSSVHLARELEKISGSGREVTISPEDKKRASSWMHYAAQYKAMGAMFAEAQQEDLQGIPGTHKMPAPAPNQSFRNGIWIKCWKICMPRIMDRCCWKMLKNNTRMPLPWKSGRGCRKWHSSRAGASADAEQAKLI